MSERRGRCASRRVAMKSIALRASRVPYVSSRTGHIAPCGDEINGDEINRRVAMKSIALLEFRMFHAHRAVWRCAASRVRLATLRKRERHREKEKERERERGREGEREGGREGEREREREPSHRLERSSTPTNSTVGRQACRRKRWFPPSGSKIFVQFIYSFPFLFMVLKSWFPPSGSLHRSSAGIEMFEPANRRAAAVWSSK